MVELTRSSISLFFLARLLEIEDSEGSKEQKVEDFQDFQSHNLLETYQWERYWGGICVHVISPARRRRDSCGQQQQYVIWRLVIEIN